MSFNELLWQGQCLHCNERFPLTDVRAHQESCEKQFQKGVVERPRSWSYDVGIVREVFTQPAVGEKRQRKFLIGVIENVLSRAQLIGYRDLLTLALVESPDPVVLVPPVAAPFDEQPPVPEGAA